MSALASAYVENGKLHIVGCAPSAFGAIPFHYHRKVEGNLPDGPVVFGAENVHPAVAKAADQAEGPIMFQVQREEMCRAARDLITRARHGDQNALAMLILVREKAQKEGEKNPRAKLAYELAIAEAKKNSPVAAHGDPSFSGAFDIGASIGAAISAAKNPMQLAATLTTHIPAVGPSMTNTLKAATAVANSAPRINTTILTAVRSALPHPQAQAAFTAAVKTSSNPKAIASLVKAAAPAAKAAVQLGYTMGTAKRIQDVRAGDTPIANFSRMAAWELGEGPDVYVAPAA